MKAPENKVCAVVVTFNPLPKDLGNLDNIRFQVEALVVVDNGSSSTVVEELRRKSGDLDFVLIEHGENLGIATAMNAGGRWAEANGFQWVIFFDQDSTATSGLVATMLRYMDEHGSHEKIGILAPKYKDNRSGKALTAIYDGNGGLEFAMSSGSLIHISTFQREGWFEDELFVGGVDLEYSLRLRDRGYILRECTEAQLLHEPSYPKTHRFFGIRLFTTSNYSAYRRYYSERNRVWLRRKYMAKFPGVCRRLYWTSFKEYIKVFLGEKSKYKKLRYMAMGVRDGLSGHMGENTHL